MWSNLRKLARSNHNPPIHHLTHQNQTFHTLSEISECLADHYSSISSKSNYETDFLAFKAQEEKKPISFTNSINLSLPYNHPISLTEVQSTIHAYFKKSAPGPDEVTPTMLQNLHPNSIEFLTSILNRIFLQANFPSQ